jgi:hypothetical protein
MCGCQQSPAKPVSAAVASAGDTAGVPASDSVALKYRGVRALIIRGPATGAGYSCYPREVIRVHSQDAAHLIASGAFVRSTV